jgi:hypothetical protein
MVGSLIPKSTSRATEAGTADNQFAGVLSHLRLEADQKLLRQKTPEIRRHQLTRKIQANKINCIKITKQKTDFAGKVLAYLEPKFHRSTYKLNRTFSHTKNRWSLKSQMISPNVPDMNKIDVTMLYDSNIKNPDYLTKDLERVIDDLKRGKKNGSDLNQHLNLNPRTEPKQKNVNQTLLLRATNNCLNPNSHLRRNSFISHPDPSKPVMGPHTTAKPKKKKSLSVLNGSCSYLINKDNSAKKNSRTSLIKGGDYESYFKFKVPEEYTNHRTDGIQETLPLKLLKKRQEDSEKRDSTKKSSDARIGKATSGDNILRLRVAQFFMESNEDLIGKLKHNYQILANWLNYVGYFNKEEFSAALKSIGNFFFFGYKNLMEFFRCEIQEKFV